MNSNIDKILYINLEHRKDKKDIMVDQLTRYGLISKSERFPGFYNSNTAYGCSMAHLNALKYIKKMGYKNVMILEDDFDFIVSSEVLEENLSKFFELNINYDFLMLAHNLKRVVPTEHDFIGRVINGSAGSGYIINSDYIDKLIDIFEVNFELLLKTGEHWKYVIDVVWTKLQPIDRWLYFTERIGKQRAGINDNGRTFVDYGI